MVRNGRASEMLNLDRGQLSFSRSFLRKAWHWTSEKKVRTFAPEHSDLIDERQIRERLREAYLLAGIIKEEIKAPARSRDSELTEVLGPLQAVERYIFSHPEYTERRQSLLERAQLLLQELQEELLA
jgi:hypothetical protein